MLLFHLINKSLWAHYINNQPLFNKLGKLLNFFNFMFLTCFTLIATWRHWLNFYHKNTAWVWSLLVVIVNSLVIATQLPHNYSFLELSYFDRLFYFIVDTLKPVNHLNLISINLVNLTFVLYVTTRWYEGRVHPENIIAKVLLVLSSTYALFFCYNLPIPCNIGIYFFLFVFSVYRCKKKLIDETAPHFDSGRGGWERRKAAILRILLHTTGKYWLGKQLIFISFPICAIIYEFRIRYRVARYEWQKKNNKKGNPLFKTPPRYPDNTYTDDDNKACTANKLGGGILRTTKGRTTKKRTLKKQISRTRAHKKRITRTRVHKKRITRGRL